MLQRALPAGFISPCLPSKTDKLPSGSQWLHEIKHDGFA
jgi:ATP-dependent DNA ligase